MNLNVSTPVMIDELTMCFSALSAAQETAGVHFFCPYQPIKWGPEALFVNVRPLSSTIAILVLPRLVYPNVKYNLLSIPMVLYMSSIVYWNELYIMLIVCIYLFAMYCSIIN